MIEKPQHDSSIRVEDQRPHFEVFKHDRIALRDGVLQDLAAYCAEISQTLWIDFSNEVIPPVLNMDWSDDLHLEFMGFRRLIDRQGIQSAGELVLAGLRQLIAD